MASVAWLLLIGMLISSSKSDGFLSLDCPKENHGDHGQRTVLKCIVKITTQGGEATIRHVVWKKGSENLLVLSDGELKEPKDGFQFAEPAWNVKNMNVSLLLTNTKMTDEGTYECFVFTDVGRMTATTSLHVAAKYHTPTMNSIPGENIKESTDVTMFCNSTGGHSKGSIQWFDEHGTNWTRSSELAVKRTDEGLFSLSSKFKVSKASTSTSSVYTCLVHNANGVKEGDARLELQFQSGQNLLEGLGDSTAKYVAPIVVIGSLITGLLIALLISRRRSRQARRPSSAPLMSQGDQHQQVSMNEVLDLDPEMAEINNPQHV